MYMHIFILLPMTSYSQQLSTGHIKSSKQHHEVMNYVPLYWSAIFSWIFEGMQNEHTIDRLYFDHFFE